MTIDDDIAFLQQVPFLRRLGAPALRILAISAETYSVEAGQMLFAAGELADCAYVVQHGSFSLAPEGRSDGEVTAEVGTLLGETALMTETRRPASATAREYSTVLRLSRAMFLKMLESFPDAAQSLRQSISARTDQWTREMENVRAALTGDGGRR